MRELIANYAVGKIKLPDLPASLKKIANINETMPSFKHLGIIFKNYTALEFAVRIKDIGLITALITAGADINYGIYKPLLIAVENLATFAIPKSDIYFNILKLLLVDEQKVDINIRGENGKNALYYAAEKGCTDIVVFLLEQPKLNINMPGPYNQPAIFAAVTYKYLPVVEKLCCAGADLTPKIFYPIDNKAENEIDLISIAIFNNDIPTIKMLLKYTKPSDVCWEYIYSKPDCEGLKLLLKCGVDPNTTLTIITKDEKKKQTTLIQEASIAGYCDFVSLLLVHGADPNILFSDETPLLCVLAAKNKTEVINILLKSKRIKNINQADRKGETPLHLAAKYGHYEAVKLLLQSGANSRLQNSIELYPFDNIILNRNFQFIPLFKADLNLPLGLNGPTSVHYAILKNDTELMTCLCTNGASPDCINVDRSPPLIFAILLERTNMINILFHFGANPNIWLNINCPPMKFAIDLNNVEAVKILIKQPNFIFKSRFLYSAIEKNFIDIVKIIINNGYDPLAGKTSSTNLSSALFYAIYLNREEIIDVIVDFLKQNNRTKDLKKHLIVYLIRLGSFIDDNELVFQISCKLQKILHSLPSSIKPLQTVKTEPEKTETKTENWNPDFFSTSSAHESNSSRSYLSTKHGWTPEKFKEQKEELKLLRIKRREIPITHTGNPPPKKIFTWLDGALNSSMFVEIEGTHGQGNHFLWLPKEEILEQKCDSMLFEKFNMPPYKLRGQNIQYLKNLTIAAPFEFNEKIHCLKSSHELKIYGSPARIFLFKLQADDCSATLYIGGKFLSNGLHHENDIKNFQQSCALGKPQKIALPATRLNPNNSHSTC